MRHANILKSVAFGVTLTMAPLAASAVTLTSEIAFTDGGFAYPDEAFSVILPAGSFWIAAPTTRTGNDSGVYRTPWDETSNNSVENDDVTNAGDIEYFAAGPDNPANPAKLGFFSDQASLSFLWGSPDTFNYLQFYLDGLMVDEFTGTLITGTTPSAGSKLVTFTGVFDEVWFESRGSNAFEFANVTTTPVPLPAGAVLILTGLGGFAFMRRRKA